MGTCDSSVQASFSPLLSFSSSLMSVLYMSWISARCRLLRNPPADPLHLLPSPRHVGASGSCTYGVSQVSLLLTCGEQDVCRGAHQVWCDGSGGRCRMLRHM